MSLKVFASEVLSNFYTTAAVAPSSKHLVGAMVAPLPRSEAVIAVEMGAGTGAMTRALLEELPSQATLIVFEINPRFVNYLKAKFPDPRLILINESVEKIEPELRKRGYDHVDIVVSSLGLGFMSGEQHRAIFEGLMPFMRPGTVLTQYQYIFNVHFANGRLRRHSMRPLLSHYFSSVESKIVWRNVPPAFVYTCHPQPNPH